MSEFWGEKGITRCVNSPEVDALEPVRLALCVMMSKEY